MSKTYELYVTQEIYDKSESESQTKCFVANTVREQIPGSYSITVTDSLVKFNLSDGKGNATRWYFDVPAKVAFELQKFDDKASDEKDVLNNTMTQEQFDAKWKNEIFEPFHFRLQRGAPRPVVKKGPETGPKRTRKKTEKKVCVSGSQVRRTHGKRELTETIRE